MSDQHPTPQWYTPTGGTTTAPRIEGAGAPTGPMPSTSAATPPPLGPLGPLGQPAPQAPAPKPARRGAGQLTAVAVLAALLASGGTVAAANYWPAGTEGTGAASSSTTLGSTAVAPVKQGTASAPDWTATASAVSPSVVSITATSGEGGGQGSGVIIDESGHVLTNNHVVSGAQKLTVTLADGRTYDAEIRGTDPSTDLAVITISNAPSDLTPVAIGDSDSIAVGDPVMAVGNPLGLAGTVTTGIVSALNRPVTTEAEGGDGQGGPNGQAQSSGETVVTNAIQTSAAINPGNSGGALVNASGQLIGINSAIATLGSASGGQSGSIGIGFAIPVNEATSIAKQLIDSGTATHAYLGVTPQDGSASDGSATRAGAEITSVGDGTPAADAGLKVGDVIVAVNGERVESADSLVGHVREKSTGDQVTLTVLRDGKSVEVKATLVAKPTSTNG
ncbi:MAG TPA: trypsin-like peptidase domain-containing protein [Ornithinibacter sp.]|nr:trypsin-like peptidase domain-containing protein [Ornithinibacter sp.]